ncbi:thioredoxin family protein [Flammeovirga sp. SJP92]|uniref:thioredoxin family protein n=1 Tax=Flammeovirga sp. SJP92 TaxID=1775430 RepID=UPI0007C76F2F|nr:thioredoxin family protein [Flammeovirga sp. SJP92]
MNKISLFFLIGFTMIFSYSFNALKVNGEISWKTAEEAITLSKKDGKPIFIDVYTDWCGWCKILDKKTFQNSDVVEYVSENYHAVKLNPEKEGSFQFKGEEFTNESFAVSHDVNSYPAIIVIHPKGKNKVFVGYRDSESFLEILKKYKRQVD